MKVVVAVLSLAAIAWWLHRRVKRRAWMDGPNYVKAIEAWKPDTVLDLPPIRPLTAQKEPRRLRRMR